MLIEESPLSATKRWRLIRIVQRAGDTAGEARVGEAEVSEAIHAAAQPGRKHDDDDAAKDDDA